MAKADITQRLSAGSLSRKANLAMSKSILFLILLVFALTLQQQTVDREEPDLSVVKFSWAKEKQKISVIRGAQNPGGPITTPIPSGASDHNSRIGDLRSMEKKAEKSAAVAPLARRLRAETVPLRAASEAKGEEVTRAVDAVCASQSYKCRRTFERSERRRGSDQ
jgi:hypothetical protein